VLAALLVLGATATAGAQSSGSSGSGPAASTSSSGPLPQGAGGGTSLTGSGWLADRSRTQGPGFRVGDFELHPGIGAEIGYDSNVYYAPDNPPRDPTTGAPIGGVTDSAILRVTPHLTFSTLAGERASGGGEGSQSASPPTVTLQGGISGAYYEFFNDSTRRNFALDVGLRLTVLPQRPFGFSVYDTFSRQIRPFVQNINPGTSMARDSNNAGLQLNFQTDGGVFQVIAGYDFGLSFYEDRAFQYGNSFLHTANLQQTFRFLPSTALVSDAQFQYNNYFSPGSSPVRISDSVMVRARAGLNGAITTNISFLAMAGYAAGFFLNNDPTYIQNFDGPVGQAQLSWQIVEGTRIAIGYDGDVTASVLGNYYRRDRGYLSFSTIIGGSFMLGVDGDVGYVQYGVITAQPGTPGGVLPGADSHGNPDRRDVRVNAGVFAEYRLTDWLGINTTLRYQGDFTDFHYNLGFMSMAPLVDPAGFNKFEAFLGVRVFY
jgi:hypothetical protein